METHNLISTLPEVCDWLTQNIDGFCAYLFHDLKQIQIVIKHGETLLIS